MRARAIGPASRRRCERHLPTTDRSGWRRLSDATGELHDTTARDMAWEGGGSPAGLRHDRARLISDAATSTRDQPDPRSRSSVRTMPDPWAGAANASARDRTGESAPPLPSHAIQLSLSGPAVCDRTQCEVHDVRPADDHAERALWLPRSADRTSERPAVHRSRLHTWTQTNASEVGSDRPCHDQHIGSQCESARSDRRVGAAVSVRRPISRAGAGIQTRLETCTIPPRAT